MQALILCQKTPLFWCSSAVADEITAPKEYLTMQPLIIIILRNLGDIKC